MFEMKARLLPSGDQVGRPTWRVMYSFSMVRLRGSTCALGLEAICLGSVIACGVGRVWAVTVSARTVLMSMTITKRSKVRMELEPRKWTRNLKCSIYKVPQPPRIQDQNCRWKRNA